MAGKYAKVINTLQPAPVEDAGYQQRVDDEKAVLENCPAIIPNLLAAAMAYAKATAAAIPAFNPEGPAEHYTPEMLAVLYHQIRDARELAEDCLSAINLRVAAIEQMLIESQDKDEAGWGLYGVSENTVKLASGAAVRIDYEPMSKVEDKEAFRLWCIEHGYEQAMQLWPSTTLSIVKERLLAGEPPPTGVAAYSRAKVVRVKARDY